ncbi:MAG TPA: DUF3455 domain-containing protein [Candidatus Acidoferrum sp.]|nr:DUF3455 domain-containing protein [Candidatus Acidoferrum sp.]
MSYRPGQQTKEPSRLRRLFVTALVLGCTFGTVTDAARKKITPPRAPADITPPVGNSAFLVGHAEGTQGYVCLPKDAGASWTVNASRPEAILSANSSGKHFEITHFLSPNTNPNEHAQNPLPFGSPTWRSSLDGSVVWAKALTPPVASGSDPSCPNTGAIPCLLLQATGSKPGRSRGGDLSQTTFIQRLNTNGGSAPATGCSVSTDVGKQALVPYTADYYFYVLGHR